MSTSEARGASTAGGPPPVSPIGRERGDAGAGARVDRRRDAQHAVALVLVLAAGLSLILALFVGIAVNSGPNGVRIAVAGPAPAIEQIRGQLAATGDPDAFEIAQVADENAARASLLERTADAAIVVGPNGPAVLTATAGSPALAQMINSAAATLAGPEGTQTTVVDVVPLPEGDSRGAGMPAGTLPVIIAGLALGAAVALRLRHRWIAVATLATGSVVIGVSFAGVLAWLGVIDGSYWAVSAAIALTVSASAFLVAGLARLMGPLGIGVGTLLVMIMGNPLSGIASSPRLLPGPWGDVGQWLPTGAGGTLMRTVAYFPDAAIGFPVWVLLGWVALGLIGVLVGRAGSDSTQRNAATPGDQIPTQQADTRQSSAQGGELGHNVGEVPAR